MMFKNRILTFIFFLLPAGLVLGNAPLATVNGEPCCPENTSVQPVQGGKRIASLQSIPSKRPVSLHSLAEPDAIIVPGLAGAALPNVADMIVGRVAGVQVWGGGGFNNYVVRIRGAMGPPLLVVDELPFYHANDDAAFNAVLQTIPTAEVASIEIIKNAAQAAIYGGQGANGVIRINTRGYVPEEE